MQITGGEIGSKEQGAAGAKALDQREEIGAVRSLTSKLSSADNRINAELYPERDLYLDMDMALPFHWASMTGKAGHKVSKSSDSQEFEFSMTSGDPLDPVVADGISPADELFYKGQLLPLHLPKRLQMVQKLSSPKHLDKGLDPAVTVSCFFQPNSLKYTPLGDEGYLGSALVNSRSSSFHSQGSTNFWESDSPGDMDSGDSSSSRDSSGSSQDACSVPEKQTLPKFNDHMAFQKEGALFHNQDFLDSHKSLRGSSEKSQHTSWLRTPFKWKLFFGSKKQPSKSAARDVKMECRKDRSSSPFAAAKSSRPDAAAGSRPDAASGTGTNSTRSSRAGAFFSAELKGGVNRKEVPGDLEGEGGGLFSFAGGSDTSLSSSREPTTTKTTTEQDGFASKGRDSCTLHKYFNILKPSTSVKVAPSARRSQAAETGSARRSQAAETGSARRSQAAETGSARRSQVAETGSARRSQAAETGLKTFDIKAKTSFSGNLTTSSSPKQQSFSTSSGSPPPKAEPAVFTKAFSSQKSSVKPETRCRSPTMHSLSSNLRVPSFSRSSKASANAAVPGGKKAASPHHSGLLNSSPSCMAELHSSIQGAIAHCKQSQVNG